METKCMFMDRRVDTLKRSVLSNLLCRFNAIPIEIPASHVTGTDKLILKFVRKSK